MKLKFRFSDKERKLLPAVTSNGSSASEYLFQEMFGSGEHKSLDDEKPENISEPSIGATFRDADKLVTVKISKNLTPDRTARITTILERGLQNGSDGSDICMELCLSDVSGSIVYNRLDDGFEIEI